MSCGNCFYSECVRFFRTTDFSLITFHVMLRQLVTVTYFIGIIQVLSFEFFLNFIILKMFSFHPFKCLF